MPVYFQWSLKGQTCLQTLGLRTAAPGKRAFSDQSRSMLVVDLTWCLEQCPCPLWTHGLIPLLKAPLPPAPTISPGCQVLLLPVDTSQQPVSDGLPMWQNPRKGRGRQWLRDLGRRGKVLQRGNLGGQRFDMNGGQNT